MFNWGRWDMRLTDREVIKVIAQLDTPCSIAAIAEKLNCHEQTVRRSIRRLQGIVNPVRDRGRRYPFTYIIAYHLLPDDLRTELGHNGNGNHTNPL